MAMLRHAMETDNYLGEDARMPDGVTWPPPPSNSNGLQTDDEPDNNFVKQFTVGFLRGVGTLIISGAFWVALNVSIWAVSFSSPQFSRFLTHDLSATTLGKISLFVLGFVSCNLPAGFQFCRSRLYQPWLAWGLLSGSCSATIAWLVVSRYINETNPGI